MVGQCWVTVGLLEGVELPVLDVTQSGRKTLADQGEQRKDMITDAAGYR